MTLSSGPADGAHGGDQRARLRALVAHLEHVLPSQAPIRDFVHHNTLHGFQHLPFPQALAAARRLTGAAGFLPLERFRDLYREGRITREDIEAVLAAMPDAGEDIVFADGPAGAVGTRDVLRVALLHALRPLTRSELKWRVEEFDALERFAPEVGEPARARLRVAGGHDRDSTALRDLWAACLEVLDLADTSPHPEELVDLSPEEIEALAARDRAAAAPNTAAPQLISQAQRRRARELRESLFGRLGAGWSLRTLLLALTGEDLLDSVRPQLIRHLAAHLDQGLAAWRHPQRHAGFYAAWRSAAARDRSWRLDDLPEWPAQIERLPDDAVDAVVQELRLLGLPEDRWAGYLERLALEIPGWSGMTLWRDRHPGYGGDTAPVAMLDYLAVRLALERLYAQRLARRLWRIEASIPMLRWHFRRHPAELLARHALFSERLPEYLVTLGQRQIQEARRHEDPNVVSGWERLARLIDAWHHAPAPDRHGQVSVSTTVWPLFLLCQHLGLAAAELRALGRAGAEALLTTAGRLDTDQAGYLWLCAYERNYREQIFATLTANHGRVPGPEQPPAQLVFCMDDREEGIRRHLEEIEPRIETLGGAAHFNVFQNWRGLDDRTVTALCPVVPVVVRPAHEVREVARAGHEQLAATHRRRHELVNAWRRRIFHGTRRGLLAAPLLTAVLAPFAPLVLAARLLAPRAAGSIGQRLRAAFERPVPTAIALTAPADSAAATPDAPRPGFTDAEQAERVAAFLASLGLTQGFAPLVVIMGHGSNSQNNPHLSAYDCGACAGRHSGANARLFAGMANRAAVRTLLAARGIAIPDSTWFVGAEHNTGDDSITWYDIEDLPPARQAEFAELDRALAQACAAHAQERCRRFASAPPALTPRHALRHARGRRYDYSQTRPELGHATNACALFGRRAMSRGAFFDRRAFLISYDPTRDPDGTIIERHLLGNGAVGAGISLEYYFSTVNNDQYGCGTKTVHNITGLFGVMEGASSDLRTGLPQQMIEIHEAMRLLVVVEQTTDMLTQIYQRQPPLQELVGNGWVLLAAKDPDSDAIHFFEPARGWVRWQGGGPSPVLVPRSRDWFAGHIDHLPPALIAMKAAASGGTP